MFASLCFRRGWTQSDRFLRGRIGGGGVYAGENGKGGGVWRSRRLLKRELGGIMELGEWNICIIGLGSIG